MTTEKQIAANRRNGALGRGPKSAAGKSRSRLNARKHGLASADPLENVPHEKILKLSAEIAAQCTAPDVSGRQAEIAARAVLSSQQLRAIRNALERELATAAEDLASGDQNSAKRMKLLAGLDRYEQRGASHKHRVLRALFPKTNS